LEFCEPSQHLLIDTGKPRKACVEVTGRRNFRILNLASSPASKLKVLRAKLFVLFSRVIAPLHVHWLALFAMQHTYTAEVGLCLATSVSGLKTCIQLVLCSKVSVA